MQGRDLILFNESFKIPTMTIIDIIVVSPKPILKYYSFYQNRNKVYRVVLEVILATKKQPNQDL